VYEPKTQSQVLLSHFGPGTAFYLGATYRTCGLLGILGIGLGLVTCLVEPKRRPVGLLCGLGYLSFFIFYSFHGLRNERYLIPAVPFLALLYGFGALAVWDKLARTKVLRLLTVAVLAVYPLVFSLPHFRMGIVQEEPAALAVQKKAGPGAVILCDDMSGPLRLYAGFSALRFTWTDDATLREAVSILQAMNRPVYFYLDSESAQARYLDLISRRVLEPKNFREIALINGRPLYKYESGDAAALTNPHLPR
jgi:4-amino-4-deoxy-L-arabinose transferase-like glycosyltransferase